MNLQFRISGMYMYMYMYFFPSTFLMAVSGIFIIQTKMVHIACKFLVPRTALAIWCWKRKLFLDFRVHSQCECICTFSIGVGATEK